ncbi:ribonuclease P protein component 4 [Nanoarchaeota archaeon]
MYKRIARKRIKELYRKSLENIDNLELARRYIYILWRIKNKARIRLPKYLRNKFCKRCYTPWIIGKTLQIRIRKGRIIYKCLYCGNVKRFNIRKI